VKTCSDIEASCPSLTLYFCNLAPSSDPLIFPKALSRKEETYIKHVGTGNIESSPDVDEKYPDQQFLYILAL
jgi:hypothetical protein